MNWRRFNELDWMGYGGAEPFKNGDQPLIAETGGVVFICCGPNGLIIAQDGNDWYWSIAWTHNTNAFYEIAVNKETFTEGRLLCLGFFRIPKGWDLVETSVEGSDRPEGA